MSETIRFSIQEKQRRFHESGADITIFGGAAGGGKTHAMLYEPIASGDIKNPKFDCVIFRRTYPEIDQPGGLWDCSEEIYPFLGAKGSRGNSSWTFPQPGDKSNQPTGATVSFRHMENESDRLNYKGSQISLIGFDQLEGFTEKQFFYLLSRNRSMCGARSRIIASVNPEPGWLADFLSWWWDEKTGYAIPERSGKVRWFIRPQDSLRWANTRQELVKKFPGCKPKSVTFILSKITDNKKLLDKDSGYLSSLMALPLVDRERLLNGNWKISIAGNVFKREWWKYVDVVPGDIVDTVRFWDCAATEQVGSNDPDWTAGVRMSKDKNGNVYISDCQHFRGTPLKNETIIQNTAASDSVRVRVRMEQEPGASGKGMIDHYARLVLFGHDFAGVPSLKKKILRWAPLSAACEQGRVFLVKGRWNQDFIDELEGCKGEDEKNDQADSASGAYSCLAVGTGAFGSVSDFAPSNATRQDSIASDSVDFQVIGDNFF